LDTAVAGSETDRERPWLFTGKPTDEHFELKLDAVQDDTCSAERFGSGEFDTSTVFHPRVPAVIPGDQEGKAPPSGSERDDPVAPQVVPQSPHAALTNSHCRSDAVVGDHDLANLDRVETHRHRARLFTVAAGQVHEPSNGYEEATTTDDRTTERSTCGDYGNGDGGAQHRC
jgi:hypothetical protein